jgi:hypothetical protein
MTVERPVSQSMGDGPSPADLHDVRALARFDLFLYTAVATVLVVRTLLAVTGYPQVGGSTLHVAHVLWGGLLMAIAIVVVEILPGSRARVFAAFAGGIGFGLFIDEIGKFLTKDVDYFFKPAIAIIYAVFVLFYLVVREVVHRRRLTDRRRLALASMALADLALGELDRVSRDYALALLDGVDDTSALAEAAAAVRAGLLAQAPARPGPEAWLTNARNRLGDRLERVLGSAFAQRLVLVLFALEALNVALNLALSLARPGHATLTRTLVDTGLPSAVSGILIVGGVACQLARKRDWAMKMLQWAVLVELLFTQVVVFNRQQWLGLVGFAVALIVLGVLRVADPSIPVGVSSIKPRSRSQPAVS